MSQGFLNAAPVCLRNYLGSAFTCFHPIFGEDVQFELIFFRPVDISNQL